MKSGSGLVIGLSLVFGCLFLALVAELYYLLWWKKRISSRESEGEEDGQNYSASSGGNYAKELLHLVCWKKPSSSDAAKPDLESNSREEPDLELGTADEGKDSLLVKTADDGGGGGEESVELELMRLHNLAGPPRFLFTIMEESKEDLESERGDGSSRKGSRAKSLSDVLLAVDFTPVESPRYSNSLESYHRQGFNPLFESSAEAELNRLRSSPPPKFKFLRDAEEKLIRRLLEEAQRGGGQSKGLEEGKPLNPAVAAEGSFLGFLHAKNRGDSRERGEIRVHRLSPLSSTSFSQVIPLASSPTATTISDL